MKKQNSIWILAPLFGTILFVALYIVAALFYPGGSQVDENSTGFSWINNYWCNLLNEKAINGQYNPAKPIAMIGMFILCSTLTFFWFLFPKHTNLRNGLKFIIQISGALSMITAFFLFTNMNHDLITNLASFFGFVATVGTFIGLFKIRWYGLLILGLFNILLVGLNNYVYYTNGLIVYLPVIQKITFAAFLFWICCIDINLYYKTRTANVTKGRL
ncbi:MAG: hypothetical protein QM594_15255 [Niabella sp.]